MSWIKITTSTRTGSSNDLIGAYHAYDDIGGGRYSSGDAYLSGLTSNYCKVLSDCNWQAFVDWAVSRAKDYLGFTPETTIFVNGAIYYEPREASLASCQWQQPCVAGQACTLSITVNQGSVSENYKLVFSSDYVGESAPFLISAGTGQLTFMITITVPTTGTKNITASLVKA